MSSAIDLYRTMYCAERVMYVDTELPGKYGGFTHNRFPRPPELFLDSARFIQARSYAALGLSVRAPLSPCAAREKSRAEREPGSSLQISPVQTRWATAASAWATAS
jgi:hypothetical protein